MGDTQSAQRDGKGDAVAEDTVQVDDVQDDEHTEDKLLPQNEEISELNRKAEDPPEEASGLCEERVGEDACETNSALVGPEEDVPNIPGTVDTPNEEEDPQADIEVGEKGSPKATDGLKPPMSEAEAKMNEINESFKRFFTSLGVKLTVKKDSSEKVETESEVTTEKEDGEACSAADTKDTTEGTTSNNTEQNMDLNPTDDNSTSSRTATDITVEEGQETTEETTEETDTAETIKEVPCADGAKEPVPTTPDEGETPPNQDVKSEKEAEAPEPTSPEEEAMSPIKRFFTTGIFSGLVKKKKLNEEEKPKEETVDKELVDLGNQDNAITPEEAGQEHELTMDDLTPEQNESEHKIEILPTLDMATIEMTDARENSDKENIPEEQSPPECSSADISNEAELLSFQERAKIQGSPLRKLLSGTGLKKLKSKRQRGKKAAQTKLTESGEHSAEQLESSTESAEHQRVSRACSPEKEENAVSAQIDSSHESEADANSDGERKRDGTWASFKKLVTPKRHVRRPSHSDDEAAPASPQEEPQPGEGEEIISTEEHKKKIDSAPWEAFLCGSGKKRSRKTSDSEDETPVNKVDGQRSDNKHRNLAESPLESSQDGDLENMASSPEQAGSPSEGGASDGSSTWKSLKKLVTPKRKAKSNELGKDQMPSDNEITKEDSSFSIKKLIPGRKKRKTDGKQEQMSSDEADGGTGSNDEHSDTPAVVPLSEFDMELVGDLGLQSQAVIESPIPAEQRDTQQDLSSQITDLVIPSDILPSDTERASANDNTEQLDSLIPVEEFEDLTEFISKHQQLSDIPEEGVMDESLATLINVAEGISRDDTIAEDFIELTSEAFTALEPIDDSLADESTEMVSAVSQLTESSKTSGNTTPIPAEQDIKVTEVLLQEVVEIICSTPSTLAVTTGDVNLESIGVSDSPQVFETSTEEETIVLEPHAEYTEQETIILEPHAESDALAPDGVHKADVAEGLITTDNEHPLEVTDDLLEFQEPDSIDTAEESPEEAELQTEQIQEADREYTENDTEVIKTNQTADQQTEFIDEIQNTDPVHVATTSPEECDVLVLSQVIADDIQNTDPVHVATTSPEECDVLVLSQVIADDIQNTDPVHVATTSSEECDVLVLSQVIAEDNVQPDTEMLSESNEPFYIQEAHLNEDIVEEEKEEDFQNIEEDRAVAKHDPVAEIITCQVEESTVSMPTIPIEATLDIREPLIDTVLPQEEIEAAHTLSQYDDTVLAETAELDDVVEIKNVPSVQCMDDHEIRVQVVDADVESAEAVVETLLNVVSSDAVEVVDVCGKQEEAVETLSATLEIEEDFTEGAISVIAQEINLQKMENQEVAVPPAANTDVSIVSSEFMNEATVHTTDKYNQYAEGYTFDIVATENIQSSDKDLDLDKDTDYLTETPIQGQERDLEEHEAVANNLVVDIIPEESSSKTLVVARREEDREEKTTQTVAQVEKHSRNAGVVSSEVNLGAPSSLTLEVKLNFQFGQTKETEYASHPVPERTEPLKHSTVSEKGVQATVETDLIRPLKAKNTPDLQTCMTKPLKLTDVRTNQESGLQAMKAVEPKRQVEDNDQDVWLDAEENLYLTSQEVEIKSKTGKPQDAVEGVKSQQEALHPDKTRYESEEAELFAIAHASETESTITTIECDCHSHPTESTG